MGREYANACERRAATTDIPARSANTRICDLDGLAQTGLTFPFAEPKPSAMGEAGRRATGVRCVLAHSFTCWRWPAC